MPESQPQELPDQLTPCSPKLMFEAFFYAWLHLFGAEPSTASLLILLAQWAFETGWGKKCHRWNIGNFKSSPGDGRAWVFYACTEYLGNPPVLHSFTPPHPQTRFRAYLTIEEGVTDYVVSLKRQFWKAWPAVEMGDPVQFAHLLKSQGYYTDDEAHYTGIEVSLFNTFKAMGFDAAQVQTIDDELRGRVLSLVGLTLRGEQDELEEGTRETLPSIEPGPDGVPNA